MKKKRNKLIVLIGSGIIFLVLLSIFILNYSKDDSSYSILEKKWISDNSRNIIDINVYNDVPVYGKGGNGVIFDFLDDFTTKYGVNYNKISYYVNDDDTLKDNAFRVLKSDVSLSKNDILMYEDNYVLISNKEREIDNISDIDNLEVMVLSSDLQVVSSYLGDSKNISYTPKDKIVDIENALKGDNEAYAIIPYNLYLDVILRDNLNIIYTLSDVSLKYVLTINDKTFLNVMKKSYNNYKKEKEIRSYKDNFLNEFFLDKQITEEEKTTYNSAPYNVGYINYMPFEGVEDKDMVGTLSNYIKEFEDIYNVDFKLIMYKDIASMKKALSNGELDLVFANFDTTGLNVDIISTSSLFKEEYVLLSKDNYVIDSVRGLNNKKVLTIKNSYLNALADSSFIQSTTYDNTDDLIRNVKSDSIVLVDKATYEYYKNRKFSEFNVIYTGINPSDYRFVIRDVNKNMVFSKMFSFYVNSTNYKKYRYEYNTNKNLSDYQMFIPFISVVGGLFFIVLIAYLIKKKRNKESILRNNDKLKYIDAMTSLKNRAYLNIKINEWDENVIYPQAFVVIDLNNVKTINDNHGHEEGDMVIKKAASILIVNQEANTDIIRTDGNEFLVYMVGYDENKVVDYMRKIYKELKDLPYGYGCSIGYSMIMDDVKTVDDAINEAMIDMRSKKEN